MIKTKIKPMHITPEELRYTNNKIAFIKEAKAWSERKGKKLTKEDLDFIYRDIQSSKNAGEFNFQESYDKL